MKLDENYFDFGNEDEQNVLPYEKQLRKLKKKLREITTLESDPYEQLNNEQKIKIELKQKIEDEIEYIKSCINNEPTNENEHTNENEPTNNITTKHRSRQTAQKRKRRRKENIKKQNKQKKQANRQKIENERKKRYKYREQEQKEQKEQKEQEQKEQKQKEQERKEQKEQKEQELKYRTQCIIMGIDYNKFINAKKLFDFKKLDKTNKETNKKKINRKYRKLSLQYHPDKGGTTAQMQYVCNARDILNEFCGVK